MKILAPSNTVVTTRDRKGRKFISIVETLYNKAELSNEEAQRVNETPGLADIISDFIAENRLPNEEVRSGYKYPGDFKPKDIREQVAILKKYFPHVKEGPVLEYIENILPTLILPEGAEGWFAILNTTSAGDNYGHAVEAILNAISSTRHFQNYREGKLGQDYLRQTPEAEAAYNRIRNEQNLNDILIIPLQLGLRHRGRSSRRARLLIEDNKNEFTVGAFTVGCVILTHPEREVYWDQLHMHCSGDEYVHNDFSGTPLFDFRGKVRFDIYWDGCPIRNYGSVSGFLLQMVES